MHRFAGALLGLCLVTSLAGCGVDLDDPITNATCGDDGQACCSGNSCFHGGVCGFDMVCRKPVNRPTNECRSADECPSNGVCGGTYDCLGNRACFLCESARVNAVVPFGGACMSSSDCLTNTCIQGRCTVPCRNGNDALCRSQSNSSQYEICATSSGVLETNTMAAPTTLSFCARRCADSVPCDRGFTCVPVDDGLRMRTYGICLRPRMQ